MLILKTYDSIVEALKEVVDGTIDGAVITGFIAESYARGIYKDQIKTGSFLQENEGLRLLTSKKQKKLISIFNQTLDKLHKENKLAELKRKWHLL